MGTNAVLVPKSTVIERLFTLIPQDGNPARRPPTRMVVMVGACGGETGCFLWTRKLGFESLPRSLSGRCHERLRS
jgi:hypothetical protein